MELGYNCLPSEVQWVGMQSDLTVSRRRSEVRYCLQLGTLRMQYGCARRDSVQGRRRKALRDAFPNSSPAALWATTLCHVIGQSSQIEPCRHAAAELKANLTVVVRTELLKMLKRLSLLLSTLGATSQPSSH